MNGLFGLDNPVIRFLFKVCDLLILNVVFVLSCVPVFTAGAALSALYSVAFKMSRGEDGYILRGYFTAFRKNFKQGTLLWLCSVVLFLFLWYDHVIVSSQNSGLFQVLRILLLMVTFVLAAIFIYIWPITARFVCTTRQIVKNALYMSIGFLPWTLILFLFYGLIWFLATRNNILFGVMVAASMACGFSLTAYLSCLIFNRIFKKYE